MRKILSAAFVLLALWGFAGETPAQGLKGLAVRKGRDVLEERREIRQEREERYREHEQERQHPADKAGPAGVPQGAARGQAGQAHDSPGAADKRSDE